MHATGRAGRRPPSRRPRQPPARRHRPGAAHRRTAPTAGSRLPSGTRGVAAVPAGAAGPDRGLRHHERAACPGAAGRAAGVHAGARLPRPGLPDRRLRRRRRPPRVAFAAGSPARSQPGRDVRRPRADGRSSRPGARSTVGRHHGLVARPLRVQAGRARPAGSRTCRTSCRSPSARGRVALVVPGDDVAGLQRLGRLLALRGSTGRPAQLGGQLRPALPRRPGRPRWCSARCPSWSPPSGWGCRWPTSPTSTSDRRPDALAGARAYVSMGHDEYWTAGMRDRVEQARDAGTNLAFLGANTMYWRVRLEDGGAGSWSATARDAALDPAPRRRTGQWRDGAEHRAGERADRHAVRVLPRRRAVPGRRRRAGGASPAPARPRRRGARRTSSASRPTGSTRCAGTPRPLRGAGARPLLLPGRRDVGPGDLLHDAVRRRGPQRRAPCAGPAPWSTAARAALTARTVRFVSRVTATVLREFARGPAGRRHPAHDNVARLRPADAQPGAGELTGRDRPSRGTA